MPKNLIAEITKSVAAIKNCQYASLTYLTKSSGKLSRYVLNLGFSYHNLVEKSVVELEILTSENENVWNDLQKQAAAEVMASLKKTLTAHENGERNEDYTKKDTYINLVNGLSLNSVDNTLQLFGIVNSETVLVEGIYKKVNSAQLTIEKNKIRKMLPIHSFREFALDLTQVAGMKINGKTLEFDNAASYSFTVNPATPVRQQVSV